jgi:hypothetical protein
MVSNRLESGDGMHRASVLPVPFDWAHVRARQQKGEFHIATVSVPGIEGRSHKVLPVLRSLEGDWHVTWLLAPDEKPAAQMLINEFGIAEERVTFVAERSVVRWSEIVAQSHVALHLHTSPFGHLAPFIQASLAHGCPVVTARSAQGEDFPENAVFHVTPGLHESAELRAIFAALGRATLEPSRAEEYGVPGIEYARECFHSERIAEKLSNTLLEVAPHVSYVMDRWQSLGRRAREALRAEVRELVSAGKHDVVSAYDRVIAPSLKDLGWGA